MNQNILIENYPVPKGATFTDGTPIEACRIKGTPVSYAFRDKDGLTILADDDKIASQLLEIAQKIDGKAIPHPTAETRRFDLPK